MPKPSHTRVAGMCPFLIAHAMHAWIACDCLHHCDWLLAKYGVLMRINVPINEACRRQQKHTWSKFLKTPTYAQYMQSG